MLIIHLYKSIKYAHNDTYYSNILKLICYIIYTSISCNQSSSISKLEKYIGILTCKKHECLNRNNFIAYCVLRI